MLAPGPHPNGHSGGILPATAERKAAAAQSPLDTPQHKLWLMFNPRETLAQTALSKNEVAKSGYTIISHNPTTPTPPLGSVP